MRTTKKYYFKFILELGRSILQGGTENLDDTVHHGIAMFDLSLFWQYKFANLLVIYQQDFFSGKGSVHPFYKLY